MSGEPLDSRMAGSTVGIPNTPLTIERQAAVARDVFERSLQQWPKEVQLIDEILGALAECEWHSQWLRPMAKAEFEARVQTIRQFVIRDPQQEIRHYFRSREDIGQAMALDYAARGVTRSLYHASYLTLCGSVIEGLGQMRRLFEYCFHVARLSRAPGDGWRYFDGLGGVKARQYNEKLGKLRSRLRKGQHVPDPQAVIARNYQSYEELLNIGAHAGPAAGAWSDGGVANDGGRRVRMFSMFDLNNPNLGHYLPIFANKAIPALSAAVEVRPGIDEKRWEQEIKRPAKRLPDLVRVALAALRASN